MPTYVYACKSCAHRFEQYQSFSEDSLVTCPECTQDTLRKVFDSVGIVFKGPGFYSTDSATSSSSTASSGTSTSSGQDSSGSADASPATTAAAPSASEGSSTSPSAQPAAAAS
ncbi:MAG: zinc ribbon domain-containing protein [Actinomycetales bacterium]|nr:zinc ribbon domain-containing protein [Actinomycetales bacterium]